MRGISLHIFFLFCLKSFVFSQDSQCPPPPETLRSTVLTYVPLNDPNNPNNFRFFYTVTVEGSHAVPNISDLHITNPIDQGDGIDLPWQLDSNSKVTGVMNPCVVLPAAPFYIVYYYHADANLVYNMQGYTAVTFNCCRPYNARNLFFKDQQLYYEDGLPFTAPCQLATPPVSDRSPGIMSNAIAAYIKVPMGIINSSPHFVNNDTILFICKNQPFSYKASATDPDGDSLVYNFGVPRAQELVKYGRGSAIKYTPGFPAVSFAAGYSVNQPAGNDLFIDSTNGWIHGFIHDTGTYMINVSVTEYRNHKPLDFISQDLLVRAYECDSLPQPEASVPFLLNDCNSFTVSFPNNSVPLYQNINRSNSTFQWDFGDGSTSSLTYPQHTYADTGTYNARLIIFPGLSCADTAYSKVVIYPSLKAKMNFAGNCSGQPIHFINASTNRFGSINYTNWQFLEDSVFLAGSSQYNASYAFTKAPQTYTALLTVGTDKGCMATDTEYVNIFQSPFPLVTHDTILSKGATLQLHANDGNFNNNGQFEWSPPFGLSNPAIPDPIVNGSTEITYSVFMKNSHGCSLVDSIHIKYYNGPDIYVPNAFTPNGDGRNDIFRPIPVGIVAFRYFRIFNRYGQLVFETSQPFKGWDGTLNGTPGPPGVYVWETRGIDINNKPVIKKGTVVLIR